MPYIASVFCVSLPGKHISLVICVRGNTYHRETHITVTEGIREDKDQEVFYEMASWPAVVKMEKELL